MNRTVYPLFHRGDIYAGFDTAAHPPHLHGWNDHEQAFRRIGGDAKIVVEIGTWLGKSALEWCRAAPNAEIVCIDTWLGAAEMWVNHDDPERYQQLRHVHGYPSLYNTFLANIISAGRQSQVTPIPLPSSIALRLLQHHGVKPDIVYIDGSHEFEDVSQDIISAGKLFPRFICGDDYGLWDGVTTAVNYYFPRAEKIGAFWCYEFK